MANSLKELRRAVIDIVRTAETSVENLEWVLRNDLVPHLLKADPKSVSVENVMKYLGFTVREYYLHLNGETLEDLLEAGSYSSVEKTIDLSMFKIDQFVGRLQAYLIGFGTPMMTSEIRKRISEEGYRFVPNGYLLAFGAQYPNIQIEHQIFSFGTEFEQPHVGRQSIFLAKIEKGREISMRSYHEKTYFGAQSRFLVFKK